MFYASLESNSWPYRGYDLIINLTILLNNLPMKFCRIAHYICILKHYIKILILGYCQSIPLHLKGIYTRVAPIHNSKTNADPVPKTLPTISIHFPWAQLPAADYKAQVLVNLTQEMTEMMEI